MANELREVILVIPGYYSGKPMIAELYYNGNDHALFVRSRHQYLICDNLNPNIRDLLRQQRNVIIFECDSIREYQARVIHEDIDSLCEEGLKVNSRRFNLHRFPVNDGTFQTGERECIYCHKMVKPHYFGKTRKHNDPVAICPECIMNSAVFNDRDTLFPGLDTECMKKGGSEWLMSSTPPYFNNGETARIWGAHCGFLGSYLGRVDPGDLNMNFKEILSQSWDNEFNIFKDRKPEEAYELVEEELYSMHLFKCLKCHRPFCIFIKNQ